MPQAFRHNRPAWLAYLRSCHAQDQRRRREDDGMSHGIIPFGAARMWQETETRQREAVLARPLPTRIVAVGETEMAEGVTVRVDCPFCRRSHEHVFLDWPTRPVDAPCARGRYAFSLPNVCALQE